MYIPLKYNDKYETDKYEWALNNLKDTLASTFLIVNEDATQMGHKMLVPALPGSSMEWKKKDADLYPRIILEKNKF